MHLPGRGRPTASRPRRATGPRRAPPSCARSSRGSCRASAYLSQLRPPLLADLGLSGAIREAADQIATALDIPVYVDLDEGVDSLPETVEIVTLRHPGSANIRKHAQPRNVRVRNGPEQERLDGREIRDDGKGFEAAMRRSVAATTSAVHA